MRQPDRPSAEEDWAEEGNPWQVLAKRTAFENPWLWIEAFDVVRPDGARGTYDVVRARRLAVGVLPIDADGNVHLVGQWRFPLARYSWEMPEGGADPGESAETCARRELAEETGLRAGRLIHMLEMDLSNSLTDERAVLFLGLELTPGEAAPEGTEKLQTRKAPYREVLARVADGRISDSLTVAAVLRAHHMAVEEALPEEVRAFILGR
ncbi:MAG: NUDIX hydrolase [Hyphomonadaceae bacterium]|nr:NUDIX hydrolase [Hyphomonadaceae bacterium]